MMKIVSYKCNRCGSTSNVRMDIFTCEFGRPLNHVHKLDNLLTGHLCSICEAEWCDKFFNEMVAWIKGQ